MSSLGSVINMDPEWSWRLLLGRNTDSNRPCTLQSRFRGQRSETITLLGVTVLPTFDEVQEVVAVCRDGCAGEFILVSMYQPRFITWSGVGKHLSANLSDPLMNLMQ